MHEDHASSELMLLAQKLEPAHKLSTSVAAIDKGLAQYLEATGLPVRDVLVSAEERRAVIHAFQDAIAVLPLDRRENAYYLSKYVVAITIGLFDAALNYLWNETVVALRHLVSHTDMQFFFDTIEKRPDVRKTLQSAEDLSKIGEGVLIDGCYRIALLSEVNHARLKHINFMRNHASAAHPNQNDLTGAEMIGWLSNCLRYVITAEPSLEVTRVDRLLHQIRNSPISPADVPVITNGLLQLPRPRIDDLLWTIQGIYCDTSQQSQTRTNIDYLSKTIWNASTKGRRHEVGARYAEFVKHAEADKKVLLHNFLTVVEGLNYRSEEVLVVEMLDSLRTLRSVHIANDNFYNERNYARLLAASLPQSGRVPDAVRSEWVKIISLCYIGNGLGYREGVDEVAENYYIGYIAKFEEPEILEFLELFADPDFICDLSLDKPDQRARQLTTHLKSRTKQLHIIAVLDEILRAPKQTLHKISNVTRFERAMRNVRA